MNKKSKIYVAGHCGLVGSAIVRKLKKLGYTNLILRTRSDLNLTDQQNVNAFFAENRPEYVFLAAAKVGGIMANNAYRGDFIYENLTIQTNVLEAARYYGVIRLMFFGSSCVYPKISHQPIQESDLLSGHLESTNEPYAIAKIAGIKMCEAYNNQFNTDFISVMPTNLYGPNDNFDLKTAHVLPALIHKIYIAKKNNDKSVTIYGTGKPIREFLHVDDLANACVFLMNQSDRFTIINIGSGHEITIAALAKLICEIIEYRGVIKFDLSKPDGTMRKLLDCKKIQAVGWRPKIDLKTGIINTYQHFLETLTTELVHEF